MIALLAVVALLEACRSAIPADITLSGRLVLRNRRGIVAAEYDYRLNRSSGGTQLEVKDEKDSAWRVLPPGEGSVLGTDVTWSDLSLDYLWWNDATELDEEESVHGQMCKVVLLRKGDRTVKVWLDRKTGVLMQAEELKDGETVRRLWGTRIRKFGDRWMANVMEVETTGSGHRTKILVEDMK